MTFIRTIPPSEADGPVRAMYDEIHAQQGIIPNWARAFSLRPTVRSGWAALIGAIRATMSVRRYELVTLAAARAIRSSYCSLAHGRVLATTVFDAAAVTNIMRGEASGVLEPAEMAMMNFAEKLALRADQISESDVAALRAHGFSDAEIFDIAATAAARCFFSKLLDALGVQADASFHDMEPAMRDALIVGRPVAERVQCCDEQRLLVHSHSEIDD
jgi:uncharacterized peroxidase-related enzyme